MAATGISIISPSTLTDVAATSRSSKSSNGIPTSISLQAENKVHAEEESLKGKSNWFRQLIKDEAPWGETLLTGLAELVGTAILVFIGCMGCVGSLADPPSQLQISLTFGFAVTCVIQLIGHISIAHINPAVTICSMILGLKSLPTGVIYMVGQVLGAVIGYGMLKVVTPSDLLHAGGDGSSSTSFCMTMVSTKLTLVQGLLTETVATGILIFLCCASWDPRNEKNSDSTALKFGLTVAALAMAATPYTGCSMNPARSFGPALWNNEWTGHWVYWLGPIVGSVIVSLAYKILWWPRKSLEEEIIAEAVALNAVESEKPEQN
ncbi:aquaporin AQPAe.a-like isoform X2 [Athalia rosae]|uniref:aquaporin AQPAe.a-like isoform X2 n=1 Tax=Athalia rosae TaxID=37344 RepID=UPI0006257A3F|nr:aquaporin AQPAe.a-like isoform X2 [Athalia rosae]